MLKKNKSTIILTSLVCLVPIIIGLLLWNKLPEKMPIHFDASGKADGWSGRAMAVFGLPAIMFGSHILCVLATCLDPKLASDEDQRKNGKVLALVFWVCPIMAIVVNVCVYMIALGMDINVTKICLLLTSLVFIIVGNYLPKCKQNYSIGIKVPWTLDDEENWNKTHHMAGKLWVIGGVLLLANVFIGNMIIMFAIIMILAFVPMVYSYIIYNNSKKR